MKTPIDGINHEFIKVEKGYIETRLDELERREALHKSTILFDRVTSICFAVNIACGLAVAGMLILKFIISK